MSDAIRTFAKGKRATVHGKTSMKVEVFSDAVPSLRIRTKHEGKPHLPCFSPPINRLSTKISITHNGNG